MIINFFNDDRCAKLENDYGFTLSMDDFLNEIKMDVKLNREDVTDAWKVLRIRDYDVGKGERPATSRRKKRFVITIKDGLSCWGNLQNIDIESISSTDESRIQFKTSTKDDDPWLQKNTGFFQSNLRILVRWSPLQSDNN